MTTKRQLANLLTAKNKQLSVSQSSQIIDVVVGFLAEALERKQRIEVRGFGAFSIRSRVAKTIRNPKTNELLPVTDLQRVYFRPSKNIL